MAAHLRPSDALLLVDVQNDFCPGGALPVPEGDQTVPVLNEWIVQARHAGAPIFASRDWHPANHVSFAERGGPWPPHCIRNTPGAEFHPGLRLPSDVHVITKADSPDQDAYSAFEGTDLAAQLHALGVSRLWVGGLAQDYCVQASVMDALGLPGLAVHVIVEGTRPVEVEPGDGDRALAGMEAAGATLERDA